MTSPGKSMVNETITQKPKDRRYYFTPDELKLLQTLVMVHVAGRIESREIEPWEARLLAKLGTAWARCTTEPSR